jgi:hypothetical protein
MLLPGHGHLRQAQLSLRGSTVYFDVTDNVDHQSGARP